MEPRYECVYSVADELIDICRNQTKQKSCENYECCEDLKFLALNNRLMQSLDNGIEYFKKMSKLNRLVLYENNIKYVPENLFKNMANLQELDLDNNDIKELQPGIFKTLTKLLDLNLAGNLIEILPKNLLEPFRELHKLNIAENMVKVIPTVRSTILVRLPQFGHFWRFSEYFRLVILGNFGYFDFLAEIYSENL